MIGRSPAIGGTRLAWTAALALSATALAFRGVGEWSWSIAVCGGLVALAAPLRDARVSNAWGWCIATGAGVLLFVAAASLWGTSVPATRWGIAAAAVAGVGEEALFRRGLYGLLERWGAAVAVAGSAVAFGLVHVPVYGWRVLAVDVGAGLVFGWQRWVTGRWSSPAVTHALGNVVAHL